MAKLNENLDKNENTRHDKTKVASKGLDKPIANNKIRLET